jgi:hypothetical protein
LDLVCLSDSYYLKLSVLPSPSALGLACLPDPCYLGLGRVLKSKYLGSCMWIRPTLPWTWLIVKSKYFESSMFARPIWFLKKIIYKNLDKKLTHQVLYLKKNAKHAIFLIMKWVFMLLSLMCCHWWVLLVMTWWANIKIKIKKIKKKLVFFFV